MGDCIVRALYQPPPAHPPGFPRATRASPRRSRCRHGAAVYRSASRHLSSAWAVELSGGLVCACRALDRGQLVGLHTEPRDAEDLAIADARLVLVRTDRRGIVGLAHRGRRAVLALGLAAEAVGAVGVRVAAH